MIKKKALQFQIERLKDKVRNLEYAQASNRSAHWACPDMEFVAQLKRENDDLSLRMKIIEDSLSIIARTLDANGIREACRHCGQKLPKEQDCC